MKIFSLKDEIYTSNIYLIDAQRPILVDTGGTLKDQILSWVPEILGQQRGLSAILFTHGHPDHIQGAEELAKRFGVPLFIHSAEIEKVPSAAPLGDLVDCGDAKFQVIHTPGHSPGGVCFYEPDEKILICGDTIFPGGRVGRWDLPGSHFHDLLESVKKLNTLEVGALYPGHYPPLLRHPMTHLKASLETLYHVGDVFDDAKYDARIASLRDIL